MDSTPQKTPYDAARAKRLAMGLSLTMSVLMLGGKGVAAYLTGSVALLSDALESVVHIVSTVLVALSLLYAQLPPDRDHPHGHGKIAYFSAGFEGSLILVAASLIVYQAISSLIAGPEMQDLGWGLAITGVLAVVNVCLGLYLIGVGKKTGELIIRSNGEHVLSDMWTSVAVLVGVGVVKLTGELWLDPVVAMMAALIIVRMGVKLIKRAYDGLMDRIDPTELAPVREALLCLVRDGVMEEYHDLQYRRVGDQIWIEVHILLHASLTVMEAHARSCVVEKAVAAKVAREKVRVTTHIEPCEHDLHHPENHKGILD